MCGIVHVWFDIRSTLYSVHTDTHVPLSTWLFSNFSQRTYDENTLHQRQPTCLSTQPAQNSLYVGTYGIINLWTDDSYAYHIVPLHYQYTAYGIHECKYKLIPSFCIQCALRNGYYILEPINLKTLLFVYAVDAATKGILFRWNQNYSHSLQTN